MCCISVMCVLMFAGGFKFSYVMSCLMYVRSPPPCLCVLSCLIGV